jgi:hypothetical protein
LELFLDLYGFVSVLLRLAELLARTLLLGSVVFWTLLALPLARVLAPGDAAGLGGIARRWTRIAAVAAVVTDGVPRFVGRSRNTPAPMHTVRVAQCRIPQDYSGTAH